MSAQKAPAGRQNTGTSGHAERSSSPWRRSATSNIAYIASVISPPQTMSPRTNTKWSWPFARIAGQRRSSQLCIIGRYSFRRQTRRAIQPDGFAVEIDIAQDVGGEVGELRRLAEARREWNRRGQRLLHGIRHAVDHRCPEDTRRDRHDPDAESRKLARHRQGHADDAGFGCRIRGLADLAFVRGDGCGVDDHAALAIR